MLDINLIPKNLRKKRRGQLFSELKIPLEIIIGSFGGLIMFLMLVHLSLLSINIARLNHHRNLKKQWDVMLPAKENVDKIIKEMRELQAKYKSIEKITMGDQIFWAKKLNILSDSIVRGVWLTRIRLNEGVFFIEGSAISKQNDEMISVHSFMANLKNDKVFLEKFNDLELGSIQRRYIVKTEVADFLITAEMTKDEEDGS